VLQDLTGYNLAAMKFIQAQIEEKDSEPFFKDATQAYQAKKRQKRKSNIYTVKA